MAILMLCDKPVYDIENKTVLNKTFCPFANFSDVKKSYERWRSNRAYLKSNRLAEQIVKQMGGFDVSEARRRMSLSDGYWVKYKRDENNSFASLTPYLNDFSQSVIYPGYKKSSSVPEVTLGGSQPKRWARSADGITYIIKVEHPDQVHAEMLAVKLARRCGIPVMDSFIELESGRVFADDYAEAPMGHGVINLVNMTNVKCSLLQLDQLGIGVLGYDPKNVAEAYNRAGVKGNVLTVALLQVVFDGIVGNADRETNNSNWAVFMDNRTGERVPSWMYDFNWARITVENEQDIKHITSHIKRAGLGELATKQAKHIGSKCAELGLAVWQSNAQRLIDGLSAE